MDYLTWTNTRSARRGKIICGTSEMCSLQGNSGGKKKRLLLAETFSGVTCTGCSSVLEAIVLILPYEPGANLISNVAAFVRIYTMSIV